MPLRPGTSFGNYETAGPIGAGGMGEVYRAKDTKLGRDIAIKVLPEELSRDKERLNRFEREARVLAQLNHTNIATIYGLEEFDGQPLLVMELVEGETLAEQIVRGPIAIDDAVAIFVQIAEGLEAAHDKGIVHRDLKPANIMLTPDGHVKILDFGLAKAFHDETAVGDDGSQSPTLTKGTALGVILGTASYMSPEQARGKPIDKRTDLWAFGCCLYEALVGRKAFVGETTTDTLAAIINAEPSWERLPAATPASVRRLLRRSLAKNVRDRLADASMARIELRESRSTDGNTAVATRTGPRPSTLLLAGLLLAAATAALTWSLRRPPVPSVHRVMITAPPGYSIDVSNSRADIDISPDGKWIAYVASAADGENRLFLRAVDDFAATPVNASSANPQNPRFSPDSKWLGYYDADQGRVMGTRTDGDRPETICETVGFGNRGPFTFQGFDWYGNGDLVLAERDAGLWRCTPGDTELERLTTVEPDRGEINHASPHVLPGDSGILFTVLNQANEGELAAFHEGAEGHRLLDVKGISPQYSPTGHILYGLDGDLRAIPFNVSRLDVEDASFHVLTGVATKLRTADFAVADDGTLVYVPGYGEDIRSMRFSNLTLAWIDRNGGADPIASQAAAYTRLQIAPSGDRVALDVREGSGDVWVWDFDRETMTRVTFDPAIEGFPVWLSDETLLFESHRVAQGNVFDKASDGTGTARRVLESPNHQVPLSVSPDGKWIVVEDRAKSRDLMLVSHETGMAEPLLATDFSESNAAISPDGNSIAYQSDESGQNEIYVRPFPSIEARKWPVSSSGGSHPVWSKDGRELFFLDGEGYLSAVDVSTADVYTAGRPKQILEAKFEVASSYGQVYDVSPDGKRFLTFQAPANDVMGRELHLVLNWFQELERLAAEAE